MDLYQGDSDDDLLLSSDNKLRSTKNPPVSSHRQKNDEKNTIGDNKQTNINKIRDLIKNNVSLKKDPHNTEATNSGSLGFNSFQQNKLQLRSSDEDLNSHSLIDIGSVTDLETVHTNHNICKPILFFLNMFYL